MRIGPFHLTYCSNIHAGETWKEVSESLARAMPRVRELLAASGPMAIGLRLSAQAAEALESPPVFDEFRRFLASGDYYVPTINGFPYGAFHGERVKERVYLPDWRDEARVEYTNRLARLLSALLADRPDITGSVSTAPGAFRTNVRTDADVKRIAHNMLRHAEHLAEILSKTGRTIVLAIEPEPACYIETIDDALAFFQEYLFDDPRRGELARRHITLCFDACHMSVEFENIEAALRRLDAAGIHIGKYQISSALRIDGAKLAPLRQFADDTYLHQVVQHSAGAFTRYTDLPDALSVAHQATASSAEWRVHYHVPIFLENIGALATTQADLVVLLRALKQRGDTACLEVETYTWDVLPAEYRNVDVYTAISRELTWVRRQLES